MTRNRKIAARPVRSGADVSAAITRLIVSTLEVSSHISAEKVRQELTGISGLVASLSDGKYFDYQPVEVLAGELRLEILTVSGDKAFQLEENLRAVPGAASAKSWQVRLPAPDLYEGVIREAIEPLEHISISPESEDHRASESPKEVTVDEEALRRVAGGGR
jgi:hypothetical protein